MICQNCHKIDTNTPKLCTICKIDENPVIDSDLWKTVFVMHKGRSAKGKTPYSTYYEGV